MRPVSHTLIYTALLCIANAVKDNPKLPCRIKSRADDCDPQSHSEGLSRPLQKVAKTTSKTEC